jgi:hypothetical protein
MASPFKRPRKNPKTSPTQRDRYFKKRVIEWTAEYRRIYRERQCKNQKEGIRSLVARAKRSDHLTRELLGQVLGKKIGIPTDKAMRWDSRIQKDRISDILGINQEQTGSISYVKELHQDTVTGDVEWIWYNAENEQDTEQHVMKNRKYQETMQKRDNIRRVNAKKDKKVRRRILQEEEDRGGIF